MKYFPLTPILHPWIEELSKDKDLIFDWINEHNSPINLINLDTFAENFQEFKAVFDKYELKHKIFFARKSNKSKSLVWAAKSLGFGVDTASIHEVKDCIEIGLNPESITVTAAIKNKELIEYAVKHQIPIILDNDDECDLLHEVLSASSSTLKVGIRLSGFLHNGKKLYSRFGYDVTKVKPLLTNHFTAQGKYSNFIFEGFHFHLNGYSIAERVSAIFQTISLMDEIKPYGFHTSYLDIGGGILMNYLTSKEEWTDFLSALKESVKDDRDEVTFQKDLLGMVLHDGHVTGEPKIYPYYNTISQGGFLEQILSSTSDGKFCHEELNKRGIELRIEPGRSILAQVGVTVARVAYRKYDIDGRLLVGLEMNKSQMTSASADFLVDPLFLPKDELAPELTEVYFVGGYCLEQDFILKRCIRLPQFPQVGDLVCFVNTAGYMMHFYERQAHGFEYAKNLVIGNKRTWEVLSDEKFWESRLNN
ncbi:Y4yA family PLP-dependent enzyme [Belliella kenyensis]|uniref:Y4yA family PLP-dependent enzyme n=1 Tax=Belliella kenyensis TaxID=1472724 RepID=A0ABV8EFL1_9BACT|nr:Y4yA family PLP-dependent enzyme [Belliella kenyensis]MCH7401113.1 Y4yA family PLP-dependent enzyme [Belliella kenyensis]MDN3604110.1 Y4yA family PLP-dependent enzyme [Belliella kenyensis]